MNTTQDIATERKLIFTNLLNGCNTQSVAAAFRKSEKEIADSFNFVVLKIKSYVFKYALLPIPCESVELARQNRLSLLEMLEKLNLSVLPEYKSFITQPLENIA